MTSKEELLKLDNNGCEYLLPVRVFKQIKQDLDKLEKLTHQSTLSECIKEWEEDGWQIDILKQFPVIKIWRQNDNERFIDEIIFYLKTLTYKIDFEADYKINNLIGKTIKALKVENVKDKK